MAAQLLCGPPLGQGRHLGRARKAIAYIYNDDTAVIIFRMDVTSRRRRRRRRSSGSAWAEIQLAWSRVRQGRTLVERPPGLTARARTAIAAVIGLTVMSAGMFFLL